MSTYNLVRGLPKAFLELWACLRRYQKLHLLLRASKYAALHLSRRAIGFLMHSVGMLSLLFTLIEHRDLHPFNHWWRFALRSYRSDLLVMKYPSVSFEI